MRIPPSVVLEPHETISAVLQHLMIEAERGRPVDMGIVLTILAALNEITAARPASLTAQTLLRGVLTRAGAEPY